MDAAGGILFPLALLSHRTVSSSVTGSLNSSTTPPRSWNPSSCCLWSRSWLLSYWLLNRAFWIHPLPNVAGSHHPFTPPSLLRDLATCARHIWVVGSIHRRAPAHRFEVPTTSGCGILQRARGVSGLLDPSTDGLLPVGSRFQQLIIVGSRNACAGSLDCWIHPPAGSCPSVRGSNNFSLRDPATRIRCIWVVGSIHRRALARRFEVPTTYGYRIPQCVRSVSGLLDPSTGGLLPVGSRFQQPLVAGSCNAGVASLVGFKDPSTRSSLVCCGIPQPVLVTPGLLDPSTHGRVHVGSRFQQPLVTRSHNPLTACIQLWDSTTRAQGWFCCWISRSSSSC
jgi:hypothetical protein